MKVIVVIMFLLSFSVKADPISALFEHGIFGVKWGVSKDEVLQQFPNGVEKSISDIKYIKIVDGRDVFNIKRADQKIEFYFDVEGRFHSVAVYYDRIHVAGVLNNVQMAFGLSDTLPPSSVVGKWVSEDNLMVTLSTFISAFSSEGILSISNTGLEKNTPNKSELGFN
jgi:hypothetical protein